MTLYYKNFYMIHATYATTDRAQSMIADLASDFMHHRSKCLTSFYASRAKKDCPVLLIFKFF
jgi:hypothetical protein